MADHTHELKATFSVWTPTPTSLHPSKPIKLHFVFNTIHHIVLLHDETQIATRSQPLMAYRLPGRSTFSTAALTEIILSKLLEYCGDVLLQWSDMESLVFGIVRSVRRLILRNATNRVRVHVDFLNYHVSYGFLTQQRFDGENYGMKPASKSATMEMLKKMDYFGKNHLWDDERCTVCLEEMGREGVFCMPCLHRFHGEGILKWLDKSHYCPICRFQMPTYE